MIPLRSSPHDYLIPNTRVINHQMEYDYDYLDITTPNGSSLDVGIYLSENYGLMKDPYIDYTAATAAGADNATFFGSNF